MQPLYSSFLYLEKKLVNEESFEQNETADMKDSFSQDDVLGLDGIFWENPKAQFRLGSLYYNGDGVERNLEKAKYWFEKSAEQGDSDAQRILGLLYWLYYAEEKVDQDMEKGNYWLEKADVQKKEEAE